MVRSRRERRRADLSEPEPFFAFGPLRSRRRLHEVPRLTRHHAMQGFFSMTAVGRRPRGARAASALLGVLLAFVLPRAHAAQWYVETDGLDFSPQFITIAAGDS